MSVKQFLLSLCLWWFTGAAALAQNIRVDPVGVNVNSTGATTVFLTFGGIANYRPAEATWCGALIPADARSGPTL